ncbi:MAG: hypothetical protein JW749_01755, partial [Sedimentisphaerales bacterium]|nr:hypothetical protein [Sedimentisphaerales bacterium]
MKQEAIIAIIICIALPFITDPAEAIILDVNVFPEQPTINDEITIITSGITSLGGMQIEGSDFEMQ